MSYGPSYPDLFRRAADLVDKILRGAKPADIRVEQPTKFELVINVKVAKVLGSHYSGGVPTARRRIDRISQPLLRCMSPLLAQSGHANITALCPL
jgi:ABC-type uncharacterized transport system substrate-binding protein